MTKFIAKKFHVLETKQVSVLPYKLQHVAKLVDGYVFHTLDDNNLFAELGIYRKHGKLYAIIDTYTGLELCTAHLRNDSKQDAANVFESRYKKAWLISRKDKEFYSREREIYLEACR